MSDLQTESHNRIARPAIAALLVLVLIIGMVCAAFFLALHWLYSPHRELLFEAPLRLTPTESQELVSDPVRFVLGRSSYAVSLVFDVPDDAPAFPEEEISVRLEIELSGGTSLTRSVDVCLGKEALAGKAAQYRENVAISKRQYDDTLPHPWTHLRDEDAGIARASWHFWPPIHIPAHGTSGTVSVVLQTGDAESFPCTGWSLRIERFIDAV